MTPVDVENTIWGLPKINSAVSRQVPSSDDMEVPIEKELLTFLSDLIKKFKPELIIVVERKGTAILRALKELGDKPLDWPWDKVISSHVLGRASDDFFIGKRILIFDDMVRTGFHLESVIEELKQRPFWDSIEDKVFTATFAIHESLQNDGSIRYPDAWFYRNLNSNGYNQLRNEIVNMLQRVGSLMLDTEHIEVRIQVKCDVRTFFETLSRKAQVISFHSSNDRLNATVYYPNDPLYLLPQTLLPQDSNENDIVKKCRVIRRSGTEFAFIPLCYPSIAVENSLWPSNVKFQDILGPLRSESQAGRFYDVALLAAVEVLKWILTDLFTLSPECYQLILPAFPSKTKASGGRDEYTLSHLRVMYPSLNIEKLTEYIHIKAEEAREKATKLRSRKLSYGCLEPFPDEQLRDWAINLCQLVRQELDEREASTFLIGTNKRCHPCGLTAKEIFAIGKKINIPEHAISVLFDLLIDNAYLVTHVEIQKDGDHKERIVRTFEPDGEVVSERIRKYTLMWGLPSVI